MHAAFALKFADVGLEVLFLLAGLAGHFIVEFHFRDGDFFHLGHFLEHEEDLEIALGFLSGFFAGFLHKLVHVRRGVPAVHGLLHLLLEDTVHFAFHDGFRQVEVKHVRQLFRDLVGLGFVNLHGLALGQVFLQGGFQFFQVLAGKHLFRKGVIHGRELLFTHFLHGGVEHEFLAAQFRHREGIRNGDGDILAVAGLQAFQGGGEAGQELVFLHFHPLAVAAFQEAYGLARGFRYGLAVQGGLEINDRHVILLRGAVHGGKFRNLFGQGVQGFLHVRFRHFGGGDLDFDALVFRQFEFGNHGHRAGGGVISLVVEGLFRLAEVEHFQFGIFFQSGGAGRFKKSVQQFFFNFLLETFFNDGLGRFAGAEAGQLGFAGVGIHNRGAARGRGFCGDGSFQRGCAVRLNINVDFHK